MTLIRETDYGTPQSKSEKLVTLEIDGHEVTVPEGTSIMRAAMELGTKIPKLCATDSMKSFGSCRLCLVEIEGRKGTPASCTTPVAEGIAVKTQSDRLAAIHGAEVVHVDDILRVEADILAPCALGAILTPQTIAGLQCPIVCGTANNQQQ